MEWLCELQALASKSGPTVAIGIINIVEEALKCAAHGLAKHTSRYVVPAKRCNLTNQDKSSEVLNGILQLLRLC